MAAEASFELVFAGGERRGEALVVEDELVLGREGVDVTLDDREVSRRHAVVRVRDDALELEDLGSRNGTRVNGERISAARRLAPGDVVRLGDTELEVRQTAGRAAPTALSSAPAATVLAQPPPTPAAQLPATPEPPTRATPAPPLASAPASSAAAPSASAAPPVAAFQTPTRRRRRERRSAASRRLAPTVLSLAAVLATAAALLVYFAMR